jgi:hypothetical protein
MFISVAKSRTVSGSSVTPRVKRKSRLVCAARTSSLPHQPSPIIAALSMSLSFALPALVAGILLMQ